MNETWLGGPVTLAVESLPEDAEVSAGSLDRSLHTLSELRRRPLALLVRLRPPATDEDWEPQSVLLPRFGGVFGYLIGTLYDGRREDLFVELETDVLWPSTTLALRGEPRAKGSAVSVRQSYLTPAFQWRGVDKHGIEWQRDFWRCPKSALRDLFRTGWSPHGPEGFASAKALATGPRECLDLPHPAHVLDCLLDTSRFVFQNVYHGSAVVILSRVLSEDDVRAATENARVHRALKRLERAGDVRAREPK